MRVSRAVLLMAALLVNSSTSCTTRPPPSIDASLPSIDAQLADLRPFLRGYPPNISGPSEKRQIEDRWHATEAELLALEQSDPDDPRVLIRLGELYRFGHNLDAPGAADRCVSTLDRLIELDPTNVDAHLTLGILYTDAGPRWAGEGENHLRRAIELAAPSPLPRGWRALTFAYYYQAKFGDAVAAADQALLLEPDDPGLRKLREQAAAAAANGANKLAPVGRIRPGN